MSKSVNKVLVLGNVGRDPEIRATGGGTTLANFSVACSERRKDASGNWQDAVEWVSLVAFGRTAEIVRDYVKKGSRLYVEGKLQTRSWEKDGEKKYKTDVLVNELVLLDGNTTEQPWNPPGYQQSAEEEVTDADIPF